MEIKPKELMDLFHVRNDYGGWDKLRVTFDDLDAKQLKELHEGTEWLERHMIESTQVMGELMKGNTAGLKDAITAGMHIEYAIGMAGIFGGVADTISREIERRGEQ